MKHSLTLLVVLASTSLHAFDLGHFAKKEFHKAEKSAKHTAKDIEHAADTTVQDIKKGVEKSIDWSKSRATAPFRHIISEADINVLHGQITKPGPNKTARVQHDHMISPKEHQFIAQRMPRIKSALKNLFSDLDIPDQAVPRIAFCCSGGGYRAMTAALGFLAGADDIGLLNATLYAAGLSGGTWAIFPWLVSHKSPDEHARRLSGRLNQPPSTHLSIQQQNDLFVQLLRKKHFNQAVTLVDPYGASLAATFVGQYQDDLYKIHLEDLAGRVDAPLPIGTATSPDIKLNNKSDPQLYMSWYEVTPYEVRDLHRGYTIPTWSFDRTFNKGSSTNRAPRQTLGFHLGIFGSAFAVVEANMFINLINKLKLPNIPSALENLTHTQSLKKLFTNFHIDTTSLNMPHAENKRISPAKINNFMKGMPGAPQKNPFMLIDAGASLILPFPPLLRPERNVDIIVVCDASAGTAKGKPLEAPDSALNLAHQYITQQKLSFPAVPQTFPSNQAVYVLPGDAHTPTIIYVRLYKNKKYDASFDPSKHVGIGKRYNTLNLIYPKKSFDRLFGLMRYNMKAYKDMMLDAIREKIKQKINP